MQCIPHLRAQAAEFTPLSEWLYFLRPLRSKAAALLFWLAVLLWYRACFAWLPWCDNRRGCAWPSRHGALTTVWRVLVCCTLFCTAAFLKCAIARLLSYGAYKTAHFAKVRDAIERVRDVTCTCILLLACKYLNMMLEPPAHPPPPAGGTSGGLCPLCTQCSCRGGSYLPTSQPIITFKLHCPAGCYLSPFLPRSCTWCDCPRLAARCCRPHPLPPLSGRQQEVQQPAARGARRETGLVQQLLAAACGRMCAAACCGGVAACSSLALVAVVSAPLMPVQRRLGWSKTQQIMPKCSADCQRKETQAVPRPV